MSAVVNCNCVTYNEDKGSTYVGSCFYNCISFNWANDLIIRPLPENPKTLINNSDQHAHIFTELAYSVVTVKRDTVH